MRFDVHLSEKEKNNPFVSDLQNRLEEAVKGKPFNDFNADLTSENKSGETNYVLTFTDPDATVSARFTTEDVNNPRWMNFTLYQALAKFYRERAIANRTPLLIEDE